MRLPVWIFLFLFFWWPSVLSAEEEQCLQLTKQPHPDKSALRTVCSEVGDQRVKEHKYGSASWFYLLAGRNKHNIIDIAPLIKHSDGNYANVAHSCVLQGDMECAKKYYGAFIDTLDLNDPTLVQTMEEDYGMLEHLYPDKKQYIDQGRALWQKILKSAKEITPKLHQINEEIIKYTKAKDYNKLLELFNKELDYTKQIFGELSLNTAALYANIGIDYNNLGNFTKSLEYKQKAFQIRKRLLDANDTYLGDSYNDMGVAYAVIGNSSKALWYLLKAADIWEVNKLLDIRRLAPVPTSPI